MGYRRITFSPGGIYHVFNRGVEKRRIFRDNHDRKRFCALLPYCTSLDEIRSYSVAKRTSGGLLEGSDDRLVDILSYCLMPSHFHLLLREVEVRGVSRYMQRLQNSYSRYFNVRYRRTGPLFSGRFQAVEVDGDEQFLHVARYIHLNPFVAGLVNDPLKQAWSSLGEYLGQEKDGFCVLELVTDQMSVQEHETFLLDHADYAREMEFIKHLAIDHE